MRLVVLRVLEDTNTNFGHTHLNYTPGTQVNLSKSGRAYERINPTLPWVAPVSTKSVEVIQIPDNLTTQERDMFSMLYPQINWRDL